jgi:hypothetical protein
VDVVVDCVVQFNACWELMTKQLKTSITPLKEERVIFLHNSAPF